MAGLVSWSLAWSLGLFAWSLKKPTKALDQGYQEGPRDQVFCLVLNQLGFILGFILGLLVLFLGLLVPYTNGPGSFVVCILESMACPEARDRSVADINKAARPLACLQLAARPLARLRAQPVGERMFHGPRREGRI